MNAVITWMRRQACLSLLLMPALIFATPTFAQVRPPGLADTTAPGSVIVYPKWAQGQVVLDQGFTDQFLAPRTELELGAVCPPGQSCPAHQPVFVRMAWVCPGTSGIAAGICPESEFTVTLSINGKVRFSPTRLTPVAGITLPPGYTVTPGFPNNILPPGYTDVPPAPCTGPGTRGFLVGWVVDGPATLHPIKFDGLIGDAVTRNVNSQLQAETAVTIQADPNLANNALITTVPDLGGSGVASLGLLGDPGNGHYQAVTGQLSGDVRYDQDTVAPFADTFLIFLTLDTRSNLTNQPVSVPLTFWNQAGTSSIATSFTFVCWGQIQVSQLNAGLTATNMGPKGVFVTGQAIQSGSNVTLLGIAQTLETFTPGGPSPPQPPPIRSYNVQPFNNAIPVPTVFVPHS